jgi:hypothetical protein
MSAPLFVLARLDDLDLTAAQMRVLVRFARRWSEASGCYESLPNIAAHCGLHLKTVRAAMQHLVAIGVLTVTAREGQTSRYDWHPEWLNVADTPTISSPTHLDTRVSKGEGRGAVSIPGYPSHLDTHKGIPLKGSQEGNPLSESVREAGPVAVVTRKPDPRPPAGRAERFPDWWAVYPNKTGKKAALALWQKRGLDALADTLISDAEQRMAGDRRWREGFIPNPTTYINQDRWTDAIQPPRSTPRDRAQADRDDPGAAYQRNAALILAAISP